MECKLRCVSFRRGSDPRRAFLPAFRVTGNASNKPGSADDKPGNTWVRRRQTWVRRRQTWVHRRQTWVHRRQVWVHLDSQWSSLRETSSSLGTLLVRLEIIATTYHSTIVKTHVFSLYSHLCIFVSIELPIYTQYIWTGCRRCLRAIRGSPENDDRVNSEIHSEAVSKQVWRCSWKP